MQGYKIQRSTMNMMNLHTERREYFKLDFVNANFVF